MRGSSASVTKECVIMQRRPSEMHGRGRACFLGRKILPSGRIDASQVSKDKDSEALPERLSSTDEDQSLRFV